jgi:hypothetical protein
MINIPARFFRDLHLIFGVSAPPEGQNELTFVLIWLGAFAFVVAFGIPLIYLVPHIYFKQ